MASKYNLKDILEEKYAGSKSSLKLTSLDDNHPGVEDYLCDDTKLDVFDFDDIKDMVDESSKSPDAIYIKDKNIYVVEFKNQDPCNIKCPSLKEKFKFSVDFFKLLISNFQDYTFIVCLVYKNQSSGKESQRYRQRAQKNACCNLHDTNKNDYNNFFSNFITQDVNFYKTNFKELAC